MTRLSFTYITLITVIVFLSTPWVVCGREHPREHPTEHPVGKKKEPGLTKEDLSDAIEAYVKKEAEKKGGFFVVYDSKSEKELRLTLEKVHKERLSKVAEQEYFACADFKAQDGKVYDLDIFMKGPGKDKLEVTEVSIHKESGKERYTWYEEGGIWKKKPVGELEKPAEKPKKEHPGQ